jgi:hypothetical protein
MGRVIFICYNSVLLPTIPFRTVEPITRLDCIVISTKQVQEMENSPFPEHFTERKEEFVK